MWRVAKSLDVILRQVNEKWPTRDKSSDGTVASDAHHRQNPSSDHEPNADGVVCARDITHDPEHGFDSYAFADMLLRNKDDRIKYVISNRRIASGSGQKQPAWVWRPYNGTNPHDHHVHISVKADAAHYDDQKLWQLDGALPISPSTPTPTPTTPPVGNWPATLQVGSTGDDVRKFQQLVMVDGIFGHLTEEAAKEFQKEHGLVADGIVGPATWQELLKGVPQPQPTPIPTPVVPLPGFAKAQRGITATVFGGAGDVEKSAYTGKVLGDKELYVALPFRFEGDRPRVSVKCVKTGKAAIATIEDVGPWNINDPYWLRDARPQAESGTDMTGRKTNLAGIDLSPALAKWLGVDGKGLVDWQFVGNAAGQSTTPLPTTPEAPKQVPIPIPPAVSPTPTPPTPVDWKDFDIWDWLVALYRKWKG